MEETRIDTALKALANTHRRDVLRKLRDGDNTQVTTEDEEVMAAMIHNHLPRLAEGKFIEYEHSSEGVTVRRGPNWEEVAHLLDKVEDSTLFEHNVE